MKQKWKNLLLDHPEMYAARYPEIDEHTPQLCRRIFERNLEKAPTSILDIGCGTGRVLRALSESIPDCHGVDILPGMIEYARKQSPEIRFSLGDMRTVRLDRTFDVILCLDSALLYCLSNKDLDDAFATFAAHAHSGTLLVLELRNASASLRVGQETRTEGSIETKELTAKWVSEFRLDRRRQTQSRKRTWHMASGETAEDYSEIRLLLPLELERLINDASFRLLGLFDNPALEESDLSGQNLYVIAEAAHRDHGGV